MLVGLQTVTLGKLLMTEPQSGRLWVKKQEGCPSAVQELESLALFFKSRIGGGHEV